MNSVAAKLVATAMNSNFSTLQSGSLASADHDFSRVLSKVNSQSAAGKTESITDRPGTDSKTSKNVSDTTEATDAQNAQNDHAKVAEDDAVSTDTEAEGVTPNEEVEEAETDVLTDEQLAAYEETLNMVSELLDIPVENLKALLQELNMDLIDLGDKANLTEVIKEVFDLKSTAELLTSESAADAIKAISDVVDNLTEELKAMDVDFEALKAEMTMFTETAQVPVEPQSNVAGLDQEGVETEIASLKEEPVFQVVDQRDEGQSESNSDGAGRQQNQTFGELMTEQLTLIKSDTQVTTETDEYQEIITREVIDQIVTKAVVNLNMDKTSITMQLNPEHLGKVAVSVTTEQGIVKGEFVAENQSVKEMLEANMIHLKSQLEEQGIKVDKIEVTLGSSNQFFDQSGQKEQQQDAKDTNNKRVGKISGLFVEDLSEVDEEDLVTQSILADEHTVEYSA